MFPVISFNQGGERRGLTRSALQASHVFFVRMLSDWPFRNTQLVPGVLRFLFSVNSSCGHVDGSLYTWRVTTFCDTSGVQGRVQETDLLLSCTHTHTHTHSTLLWICPSCSHTRSSGRPGVRKGSLFRRLRFDTADRVVARNHHSRKTCVFKHHLDAAAVRQNLSGLTH